VNGGIRNKDCSFLLGWCFGSTGLVVGLSAEADDRQRQVNSCFVPIRAGGETRERPFAGNPENAGAAIRYALVIFLP
jgi:hypothetical protein